MKKLNICFRIVTFVLVVFIAISSVYYFQTPIVYAEGDNTIYTDDPGLLMKITQNDALNATQNLNDGSTSITQNADGSLTISGHSSIYQDGVVNTTISQGNRGSSSVTYDTYDSSGNHMSQYTVTNDAGTDYGTTGSVTNGYTVKTVEVGGSSGTTSNVATSPTRYYTMGWTVEVKDKNGNVIYKETIPRGEIEGASDVVDFTYETQADGSRVEQTTLNLDYLAYASDEARAAIESGNFAIDMNPVLSVTTTGYDGEDLVHRYQNGAFIFKMDENGKVATDENGDPITMINPNAPAGLKKILKANGITEAATDLEAAKELLKAFGISTNKIASAFNKRYEEWSDEVISELVDEVQSEYPYLTAEEIYELLIEMGTIPDPDAPEAENPEGFIYQVWTGGSSGIGTAKIEYYNDSREYNDDSGNHVGFADAFDTDNNGEGIIIPSSEKYLTGITAQTYTGTVGISMGNEGNTFEYPYFTYTYTQLIFAYHTGYMKDDDNNTMFDSSGNPIEDNYWYCRDSKSWDCGYQKPYDSGFSGTTYRSANFIYISDLDLYDFESAETANETFTTGTQTFKGTDNHVLYDINPEEDGNGDPIGPVDSGDISSDDLRSTANGNARPGYFVNLVGSTSLTNDTTGTTDNSQEYDFSNPGQHISWGSWESTDVIDLGTFTDILYDAQDGSSQAQFTTSPHSGAAQAAANDQVDKWVGDGKKESTNLTTTYYATYENDSLSVGYSSNPVLASDSGDVKFVDAEQWSSSGSWPEIATSDGKTIHIPSYLLSFVNTTISNMNSYILQVPDTETYETTPAFGGDIGEQQVIDSQKANGEYPTTYNSASYKHVLLYSNSTTPSPSGNLKGVYSENDPIIVQTPVVSPVSIYDDPDDDLSTGGSGTTPDSAGYEPIQTGTSGQSNRKTQLANYGAESGRNDDLIQLRLDESYWFKFDAHEHLSTQGYADWTTGTPFDNTWSQDDIKFDKYVKAKYVHFPFAVCVYEKDNTLPTYYPLTTDESDPDYWIKIYDQDDPSTASNIVWTRFYIPSWAIEGSYPDTSGIKYKVESINVVNGTGEHEIYNDNGDLSDATSDDHELYIATYNDVRVKSHFDSSLLEIEYGFMTRQT